MITADYIAITINAIFTGMGVAIGQEVHLYLKERKEQIKKLRRDFGLSK